jgi:hypothetical protein
MIDRTFVTAGKSIFTLENSEEFARKHDLPNHYTFKVRFKEGTNGFVDNFFVSLLTGPENTSDYTYVGLLNPENGAVRLTRKSSYNEDSMVVKLLRRTLMRVWEGNLEPLFESGFDLHHEGRCGRCGRVLTVPESIQSGIGPECAKKI